MKGYRISIIRHGMTEANESGIYIGSTDMPLSGKGAGELASKMDEFDYPSVQRVYSSPLSRCIETAEILFPETELVKSDGMREINLGEFEGKTVAELLNRDDYKNWLKGGRDTRPPKGESLDEMTARTFSALHSIINDMMSEGITRTAIITHAGIITNLLTCFGLPKYDPKYLQAKAGEGFDIMVTTQMWLNSQAFEILGYCPYDRISDEEYE
ncbi:MAG: histidine phosphatase family protein [Ruminococcus flavefaciens]|nr:histidine phosphatase family protein [Ruminococcus flavefaciens]MCM1228777.1 histidine phosphatase family protein [Ruminococcus flavefaciens]